MLAAQRLSEAVGVGLDEVLAAVRELGSWEPTATLSAEASLTAGGSVGMPAMAVAGTVFVSAADAGSATEAFSVVRQADVEKLSAWASRGGIARLSTNQRILVAVILIAAIFHMLPPAAQAQILDGATLAAAVTTVLVQPLISSLLVSGYVLWSR